MKGSHLKGARGGTSVMHKSIGDAMGKNTGSWDQVKPGMTKGGGHGGKAGMMSTYSKGGASPTIKPVKKPS